MARKSSRFAGWPGIRFLGTAREWLHLPPHTVESDAGQSRFALTVDPWSRLALVLVLVKSGLDYCNA